MNILAFQWTNGRLFAGQDNGVIVRTGGVVENIKAVVAEFYGISDKQLEAHDRHEHLIVPRWICWKLLHEKGWKLTRIADEFGGRDHASVIYGLRELNDRIKLRKPLKEQIELLRQRVG